MSQHDNAIKSVLSVCNQRLSQQGRALISHDEPFICWLDQHPRFAALFSALAEEPLHFDPAQFEDCFMSDEQHGPRRVKLFLRVWRGQAQSQLVTAALVRRFIDSESIQARASNLVATLQGCERTSVVSIMYGGSTTSNASEVSATDENEANTLVGVYGAMARIQSSRRLSKQIFVFKFEGDEWLFDPDNGSLADSVKSNKLITSAEEVLAASLGLAGLNLPYEDSSRLQRLDSIVNRFCSLVKDSPQEGSFEEWLEETLGRI